MESYDVMEIRWMIAGLQSMRESPLSELKDLCARWTDTCPGPLGAFKRP